MWRSIAVFILRFRIPLLALLFAATGVMGYYASQVKVGYEFTRAIPVNNPKYIDYQAFRKKFGEDGNLMVVGVQTPKFFEPAFFHAYATVLDKVAKMPGVDGVLSIPSAVLLYQDSTGGLKAGKLLATAGDDYKNAFLNLPFYKGFLYNPETQSYLAGISINKDVMNSEGRIKVVNDLLAVFDDFGKQQDVVMHYSGLPRIRTFMGSQVQAEMKLFIILSLALTALILFIFFRSLLSVLASMLVVGMGVVWAVGTLVLLGYKVSILTALIPPLIVVIGIPNCVYFLNKYHSEYARRSLPLAPSKGGGINPLPNTSPSSGGGRGEAKRQSLIAMVERMAIITLFTNLTAAIGFGVFYFTKSTLLNEFGLVAGINLMVVFLISLIFIPAFFSFLPPPHVRQTSYMNSGWINRVLDGATSAVFRRRIWVYGLTALVTIVAGLGIYRLRSETHIVDDLPKSDKVYQDLKFFEANFKGVMPLEMEVDTRKKYGATFPKTLTKIDSLHEFLKQQPEIGNVLCITEGIKFAAQANAGGDSSSYFLPDESMLAFAGPMLQGKGKMLEGPNGAAFTKLLSAFMDSTKQTARISVSMADIGSRRLPALLARLRAKTDALFPKDKYTVTYTGTTPVFLEGSTFIINSLRDSLVLAFIMIFGCMIVLFRSWRVLLISILVNVVPLAITAGIMGWIGVPMKPSTVLVFSVALGITIDVTIRFLVSFKQEMALHHGDVAATVKHTIHDTGLSIIYTSLILIAGFAVFCLSHFDGTKSLGYLTSLTLLLAMVTNLTLQPALLLWMGKVLAKRKDWQGKEDGTKTVVE